MTQNNTIFLNLAHYTKALSFFLPSSSRCATQQGPTEQPRAGGCGRTGRGARTVAGEPAGHVRTDQSSICFSIYFNTFIKHFFLPCTFCFLLTPDICSPILTPLHLLAPFATTFFFRG